MLVHAASGGVGHAAIQLARRLGANVIATASSRKQGAVRALGVEHVFDSRSTAFERQVLDATGGRGVDVVLNCLTGDAIPASLRCLAPNGRFVEIGKIGVWTREQVAAVRPDVAYTVFDMADVFTADHALHAEMLRDLADRFERGELRALPVRRFALADAIPAFRLLAKAEHVGKVVVDVAAARRGSDTLELRRDASYLVTGGLGALGLLTARRLAERGAGTLVLCGRRAPDEDALRAIAELEQLGARVVAAQLDVTDADSVRTLVRSIEPPLAGVVHAAGVLDDGLIGGQDEARFARVLAPKVAGALNLDAATRDLQLDMFVLFSSMSAITGNAGQTSYAAANAFLDALAHHRRALGLPALSIGWGPWAEGGMAARLGDRERARIAEQGLSPIVPEVGLDVFERLVANRDVPAHVGVLPVRWPRFLGRLPLVPPFLENLASGVARASTKHVSEDRIRAELPALDESERPARLEEWLREQLAGVMGFASGADVDPNQPFVDMGIDSLLAVDLRNRLEIAFEVELPVTFVFDNPDVAALTASLASELATKDDDEALLDEIENLSDEEVLRRLEAAEKDGD
ncbi:MAG: SDR family NAD(P)-dependent oxidoreductase [Planctomycetota bacterium]